ncbi:MAG: class I mannose-6-phosphate isomerase [Myxococcales bacterium]|nr:MAG: class I mannose-6-phosphate isomerase [Myxococcales bacterium]
MKTILLKANNFTPLKRTPWAGTRIAKQFKNELGLDFSSAQIGESWELSVEPDFPSYAMQSNQSLAEILASEPEAYLGKEYQAGRNSTALLVKLLDAGEALSVQIHPSDNYQGLKPEEAGKPESWYVLAASPNSGVYVGLKKGASKEAMRQCLQERGDFSEFLHFVALEPGDFLVIEAGMPHAVGAGVTLIEPQHVLPGKRGVTYRYWDWNRRYAKDGSADPQGSPRELHLDHALAVTNWDLAENDAWLTRVFRRSGRANTTGSVQLDALCGKGSKALPSDFLNVSRIQGNGSLRIPDSGYLMGLTVVAGEITIEAERDSVTVKKGESAAIPAVFSGNGQLHCKQAHALISTVNVSQD